MMRTNSVIGAELRSGPEWVQWLKSLPLPCAAACSAPPRHLSGPGTVGLSCGSIARDLLRGQGTNIIHQRPNLTSGEWLVAPGGLSDGGLSAVSSASGPIIEGRRYVHRDG